MTDLADIRTRHAADDATLRAWHLHQRGGILGGFGGAWAKAHADRGVLLAELTDNERVLFEAGVRLGRCARERDDLRAALDRLAAVTEADILLAIKFCATDREQAAAVLALLRARLEA